MPIFISYSHADKSFVDKLAIHLIKQRTHVWVDRWELAVGDSLIQKVQEAVAGSSALIVVLSPESVASEWCKKELSVGLIRELKEKRVVVLPVLLKDCEIPAFLSDKLYADFRTDFDVGLKAVMTAVERLTNDTRSRIETPEWHFDWAMDWAPSDRLELTLTVVEQAVDRPYSCLTVIKVVGNEGAYARYKKYLDAGLDWLYRQIVVGSVFEAAKEQDTRMVLGGDPNPQKRAFGIMDERLGIGYDVRIECRLLGEDTGADVLLDIVGQLDGMLQHMLSTSRKPTRAELERFGALTEELKVHKPR